MSSPLVAQFDDQTRESVRQSVLEDISRIGATSENLPIQQL